MNSWRLLLLLAMLISGLQAASAQEESEINELTQALVSERIQILRDSSAPDGDDSILQSYQQVLNWLAEADAHAASEKTYLDSLNSAPQLEAEIRERMETTDYGVPGINPASVSKLKKSKIEDRLTELRVELRDTVEAKADLERRIASEQGSAPNIQARFEAIDSRIQELPADVISIEPNVQPSQLEATQWSALAERTVLTAERRSLEARLSSQPVRYSRRRAQSDELTLKVDGLQIAVQTQEAELAARVENLETESSVSLDESAPGYEFVALLLEKNAQLREQRTRLGTTLAGMKEEDARVRQTQLSLQEQFEAVQQIVSQAHGSSALGLVLMAHWHQADNFRLHVTELSLTDDIGDHVIERAEYEELQAALPAKAKEINMTPDLDEEIAETAGNLVRSQRELLTDLIAIETELINLHGSIDRTHQQLGLEFKGYQRYLSSRILWVPSHPPIPVASLKNIRKELGDFVAGLSGFRLAQFTWATGLLLVIILASLALRRKMYDYLQSLNAKVGRVREDSIRYTFRALLLTLIRSIAVPLLLLLLAGALESTGTGAAPYLAASLTVSAETLFLFLLLRIACEENGLANVHFGWSHTTCQDIRRLANWLLIWWWPLALATAFVFKVEVNSINVVFGRLFFSLTMVVLGVVLPRYLWPQREATGRSRRLRIWGSIFIVSLALFFIACSLSGYLYTANIMYDALIDSLLMGVGLIFFYYFMQRWLLVVRRRLRFQELLAARQALGDDGERMAEPDETNLVNLSESVSRLLKAGTLALGVLGIGIVWAPLFRALDAMQRVTLWTISDVSEGEAILTSITLASLALALLIGVITFLAARNVPNLVALLLRGRKSVTPGSSYAIVKLLAYLIVGIGVIAVLSTLGLRWERLQWLVAALGVGIGFGLQEIIANFISGLIILFERPIRVGDVITVGESSGQVIRITIRATTIRDFDGKELLVPNKEFVTGRLLNWTLSNSDIRMVLDVGIAYGSDVRKAVAILEDILENHEMILQDPAPDVLFREFGDSSLVLTARYFFNNIEQRGYLLSDLHMKINDAFAEAGIVIAFPQVDVHFDQDVQSAPRPA